MLNKYGLKQVIDSAQAMQKQGRHVEVIDMLGHVLGQHPNNPYLLYVCANSFMWQSKFGLAIVLLQTAIREKPDFPEVLNNLAVCYRREFEIDKARDYAQQALKLKEWPDPYNNLAGTCVNEGCPELGLEWADKALALTKTDDPKDKIYNKCLWNKALMELELGMWNEGFRDYWSGLWANERDRRNYSEHDVTPLLTDLNDLKKTDTIVVYGEQGVGDEIMFASCLQDLIDTGAQIILDAHPRLVTLFDRSFGLEIHGTRKRDNITWALDRKIDWALPIGSLPSLFRRDGNFPQKPYLKAHDQTSNEIRDQLYDGRPIIGLAWNGGTKKTNNLYRQLPKEDLEAILSHKEYKFVCLEYERSELPEGIEPAWQLTQHFNYDLTACLVDACDAVIAVNTSVVHLAGALGKRVFTLTPSKPAWRYGVKGNRMVWYPDVYQYRQNGTDWPINKLMGDIALWANLRAA